MLVNADRIWSFCIIAMLVDAFIGTLCLYLPYILLFVALDAKTQVESIPAFAPSFVSDFVLSAPGLVRKDGRRNHMIAALRVRTTAARGAPPPWWLFLPHDFIFANFCLP